MFQRLVGSCLVIACLTACTVGATELRARLVDASGNPLAGATVAYENYPGSGSAVSDANGLAVLPFENLNPWCNLWAVSADGKRLARNFKIDELVEGTTTIPEITLTLNDKARIISGSVVDADGNPCAGVTVGGTGQTPVPYKVKTDEQGQFRFAWPTDTALQSVYAIKPNLGFDFVATGEPDDISFAKYDSSKASNGPFALKLRKAKTVRVRVVDAENTPLAGAGVGPWLIYNTEKEKGKRGDDFNTAGGGDIFSAKTDSRGIATLTWIPEESTAQVTFSAWGAAEGHFVPKGLRYYGNTDVRFDPHAPDAEAWWTDECTNGRCTLSDGEKWMQPPVEKDGTVVFTLPPQARVAGTVAYADGKPVSHVMISRKTHDRCGHGVRFTNAKGEFQLAENVGTKLNLAVESEKEAAPALFAYDTGDGLTAKRLDIVLQPGVTLRGRVFAPEDKPFSDDYCRVVIYEMNPDPAFPDDIAIRQTSILDAEGAIADFRYVLPPGKFKISASSGTYFSDDILIEVKPDDKQDIPCDIRLKEREKSTASQFFGWVSKTGNIVTISGATLCAVILSFYLVRMMNTMYSKRKRKTST